MRDSHGGRLRLRDYMHSTILQTNLERGGEKRAAQGNRQGLAARLRPIYHSKRERQQHHLAECAAD